MILRRPRASADLSDIWEFIAEDNVDRADQFIDRIDAKFRALADQPQMGRARDEVAPGLRSFPVPPYVIFYEPLNTGIAIVRVLHGARDVGGQFAD